MRKENVDIMKQSGTIVLLSAEPKTILKRVENEHDRPLLENNKTIEHIQELMKARKPYYESAADVVIETDGKSASKICEEILEKIQE